MICVRRLHGVRLRNNAVPVSERFVLLAVDDMKSIDVRIHLVLVSVNSRQSLAHSPLIPTPINNANFTLSAFT